MFKTATTASLIAALSLLPAERAEADAAEFLGGAIIGGVIGHALSQGGNTRTTRTVRPRIPVTEQGRQTQTALNYFGFNAGSVDGQIGRGTRAAIERYQAAMGYPINGREFASWQFDFLMDAYFWAQQTGAQTTGLRNVALLYAYRDQVHNGGTLQAAVPAPVAPVAPPATVVVNPAPTVSASGTGAVPNLFANSTPAVSLANTCNSVMLQTSTNGGYMTLANMSDPSLALSEQFCVARTYAVSEGERLMQNIVGLTQAQVAEQCGTFTDMIGEEIDRASLVSAAEMLPEMREFALGTGIPPADLAATSRVCLSVGYTQDDMRMAVGSALVLAAMGEVAYGELLGHHLREGFGTTTRPDLAMQWYDVSLTALEGGAAAAFMPGQPDRIPLLRQATLRLTAPTPVPAPVPAAQDGSSALPTFTINQ